MVAKEKSKTTMKRKAMALDSASMKHKGVEQKSSSSAAEEDLVGKKRKKLNTDPKILATPLTTQEEDLGDELDEEDFGMETGHLLKCNSSKDGQRSNFETAVYDDGRLRIRPDISLEGPQYAGRSIGRRAAFAEGNGSESGSEQSGKEAFINEIEGKDFDSEEEEEDSAQGLLSEALIDEMDALNKEYQDLQAEEQEMLHGLKVRSDEDMQKAQAVKHQKALWDKALELRILLQKPFSSANRLPKEDVKTIVCEDNIEVKEAFSRLTASSIATLGRLSELFKVLLEQNSTVNEVFYSSANGENNTQQDSDVIPLSKSSNVVDELWKQLGSLHSRSAEDLDLPGAGIPPGIRYFVCLLKPLHKAREQAVLWFVPFRNSSVDKWQRKTQLSSGAAASKSKLRAFNQSITQQIENYMRDPSRTLQRMCLKQSSVNILGMPVQRNDGQIIACADSAIGETQLDNKGLDGDPELVDDTEFYQELLHEFLESSDPASIGNVYAFRKLKNKKRKVVDRRASKGRKIRYNVHEKIVNFMAPVPMNLSPMAEKLLSNLFGQHS